MSHTDEKNDAERLEGLARWARFHREVTKYIQTSEGLDWLASQNMFCAPYTRAEATLLGRLLAYVTSTKVLTRVPRHAEDDQKSLFPSVTELVRQGFICQQLKDLQDSAGPVCIPNNAHSVFLAQLIRLWPSDCDMPLDVACAIDPALRYAYDIYVGATRVLPSLQPWEHEHLRAFSRMSVLERKRCYLGLVVEMLFAADGALVATLTPLLEASSTAHVPEWLLRACHEQMQLLPPPMQTKTMRLRVLRTLRNAVPRLKPALQQRVVPIAPDENHTAWRALLSEIVRQALGSSKAAEHRSSLDDATRELKTIDEGYALLTYIALVDFRTREPRKRQSTATEVGVEELQSTGVISQRLGESVVLHTPAARTLGFCEPLHESVLKRILQTWESASTLPVDIACAMSTSVAFAVDMYSAIMRQAPSSIVQGGGGGEGGEGAGLRPYLGFILEALFTPAGIPAPQPEVVLKRHEGWFRNACVLYLHGRAVPVESPPKDLIVAWMRYQIAAARSGHSTLSKCREALASNQPAAVLDTLPPEYLVEMCDDTVLIQDMNPETLEWLATFCSTHRRSRELLSRLLVHAALSGRTDAMALLFQKHDACLPDQLTPYIHERMPEPSVQLLTDMAREGHSGVRSLPVNAALFGWHEPYLRLFMERVPGFADAVRTGRVLQHVYIQSSLPRCVRYLENLLEAGLRTPVQWLPALFTIHDEARRSLPAASEKIPALLQRLLASCLETRPGCFEYAGALGKLLRRPAAGFLVETMQAYRNDPAYEASLLGLIWIAAGLVFESDALVLLLDKVKPDAKQASKILFFMGDAGPVPKDTRAFHSLWHRLFEAGGRIDPALKQAHPDLHALLLSVRTSV